MKTALQDLLKEIESYGKANDQGASKRQQKMLNITPETGVFLSILIQSGRAKRILEIGTSNGYSTLWLANAVDLIDGKVTTVEIQDHKIEKAKSNFAKSGLGHRIELVQGDAGSFLKSAKPGSFDLIFLDSDREQYVEWWNDLALALAPGGLLIVDNATSHESELVSFRRMVDRSGYESSLVPIGNGELVVLKPLQKR
jgi:predicted O-methyltransferase YrrM